MGAKKRTGIHKDAQILQKQQWTVLKSACVAKFLEKGRYKKLAIAKYLTR
jgi:hypothetical protein